MPPDELILAEFPLESAVAETRDDVEDISEQLIALAGVNSEKHSQILEEVRSCQNRLEALSLKLEAMGPNTESPVLTQVMERLIQIQTELAHLKEETTKLSSDLNQSKQEPKELVIVETSEGMTESDSPNQEGQTVDPEDSAEPVEPKRKKYHRL